MRVNIQNSDSMMKEVLRVVEQQIDEKISAMLNEGISKGFISVRKSDPVLTMDHAAETSEVEVKLHWSAVIDYNGAEMIENLQKSVEQMKKTNADLHNALSEFYEKTKVNTWLKNTK